MERAQYHDRFWTLDPIDGTKGFLRGEQYAVALALIVGGEVVVAALACPQLDARPSRRREANERSGPDSAGAIFTAVKAKERSDGRQSHPRASSRRPSRLRVNDTEDPAEVRFCESVESGHSAHGDSAGLAQRLGITGPPLRMDSQAKYAVVARGEAEIYLRLPTRAEYREKIWDHAAGALIVARGRRHGHRYPRPAARVPSRARAHRQPGRDREQRPAAHEGDPGDRRDGHRLGLTHLERRTREKATLSSHDLKQRNAASAHLSANTVDVPARLGLAYMAAFASMAAQVDGLIGSNGILPAADYLKQAGLAAWPGAEDVLASAELALAERVRSCPARAVLGRPVLPVPHFSPEFCRAVALSCSGSPIFRSRWPDRSFWVTSGIRCCSRRACWRCSWHPGTSG